MILAAMAAAASVMANRRAIFDGLQQTANIQNKQPEGLDGEMFPFYALLPDREKVVYEEILAGIENGEKEIVPSYELRRSTVSNILHYIIVRSASVILVRVKRLPFYMRRRYREGFENRDWI